MQNGLATDNSDAQDFDDVEITLCIVFCCRMHCNVGSSEAAVTPRLLGLVPP